MSRQVTTPAIGRTRRDEARSKLVKEETMDIYEALYTTRAMRRLKPDPIPYDVQARILDAAIRAPNVGQEWRFLLVDDPEIKSRLAPLYRQAFERLFTQYGLNLDELLKSA